MATIHTFAFSESQDAGGSSVLMAGVPDQTLQVNGDDIQIPEGPNKMIGAISCAGATASRVYLTAPSLRQLNPWEIDPLVLALFPTTLPQLPWNIKNPLQLKKNENLNCYITSDPASAERASTVVWLVDSVPQKEDGEIFHARFTLNVALLAGEWANAQISFIDDLPSGVYKCGGAELVAATAIAARFFAKGSAWRPGFPVKQTKAGIYSNIFRNFELGSWFEFDQTNPPSIDILSSAAAAAADYVGTMDLILAAT